MPTGYNDPNVTYDTAAVQYDGTAGGPQTPYPNVGVFIAFDDGPYIASPAWTDISTMVREITIHRGRGDDFEQFDTGTAQLVLDNRMRTFDPFYTAGTYYGKLTPRRQIRIVGQANGVNYDVFRGYVAGWPVQWSQAGKDSTVTIQCFDALGLMANEIVPTDWPDYYISSLSPYHYYKCNDSRGSATVKDSGTAGRNLSNVSATYPNLFEQSPLADGLVGSSAALVSYWTGPSNTYPMTNSPVNIAISGWLDFSMSVAGIASFNVKYAGLQIEFKYYAQTVGAVAAGTLDIRYYTTTYAYSYSVTQALTASIPHFWAINFDATAQTLEIYLDNVNITQTRTAFAGGITVTDDLVALSGVTVQQFCVFTRKLTTTEITNIYNYGTGRIAETTTARMNRLIGTTDYPAALTNFTASPVATVSEIGSGSGVIPEMQLVADSEGGEIYVSKDGKITTTNRTDVFTATRSTVSQATFTDSGAGLSYGPELLIEYDGDAQRNDITVQFSGDGEVNAYNDYATTLYGGQATTIETQLADPTSAANLALVELGVEGSLIPRISPVDVSSNTAAASWQTILGLELLDRVTFKRTPTVGNQFDRDALVNAIDHQIVPGVWNTQLTLSMRYTSPETLDDDVLGLLDLNYLG